MRRYFYKKLRQYLDLYVRPNDRIVEIDAKGSSGLIEISESSRSGFDVSIRGSKEFRSGKRISSGLRFA